MGRAWIWKGDWEPQPRQDGTEENRFTNHSKLHDWVGKASVYISSSGP